MGIGMLLFGLLLTLAGANPNAGYFPASQIFWLGIFVMSMGIVLSVVAAREASQKPNDVR